MVQVSMVRDQGSGINGQGSMIRVQGSMFNYQRTTINDQVSENRDFYVDIMAVIHRTCVTSFIDR